MSGSVNKDTFANLQAELCDLKREWLSGLQSQARDRDFEARDKEIAMRFRQIGEWASYPDGFLEGLSK